ncbi:MAG: BatA domain-containing protein [Cytophagales bacterium]|nr:BatA domain-containing protein [Cytophagales bacterium]
MSFLRPEFLWGLGALAIPVLVHLFSFRRTRKVFFSNTRFISQITEETSAKRKIKQWLILSARMLCLLFLVLAFAQPFLPAEKQHRAGKPVLLYVDNSFSLTIQNGNATLLEQAIGYAQNLVKAFPSDTRFVFFTNNSDSWSNKPRTAQEVTEYLTQVKPALQTKHFSTLLEKHNQWLDTDAFFVLSDFQSTQFTKQKLKDSLNYVLIPFQKENRSNIFFDSVYLQNPFLLSGEKNKLVCVVHHTGKEPRTQVLVKFLIDDKQAGSLITDLLPDASKVLTFEIPEGLTGIQPAKLTVADAGNAFDNEFFLSLDFSEKISVAEIKSASATSYIKNVFANTNVFTFESFSELNVNFDKASSADLLILNEIPTLTPAAQNAVSKIVQRGGSVLLIPAKSPDVASFKTVLPGVNLIGWNDKLGLKKMDYNNPFFTNVFETQQENVALPSAKAVWQTASRGQSVLTFVNDIPFLSYTENVGRVYTLACPLQDAFTDFGTHALFVPVMYKMAALSKRDVKPLASSDNRFTLSYTAKNKEQNNLVKLIGNTELVPEQTHLSGKIFLNFDNLALSPGHYYAVTSTDTLSLVAANANKSESYGEVLSENDIKSLFGSQSSVLPEGGTQSPEEVSTWINEQYKGKPLWKLALVFSLLFLAAEIFLIRFL